MRNVLLLFAFLSILNSCATDIETKETDTSESDLKAEMKLLEKHNTESYLIKGTSTYDSIIANANLLSFFIEDCYMANTEYSNLDESFDTIVFLQNDNHIEIVKSVYTAGSCLEFLPYSFKRNDTLFVKMPDTVYGGVYVENNDTLVTIESCTLKAVSDIIIKIDSTQYSDLKTIMFEEYYYSIKE